MTNYEQYWEVFYSIMDNIGKWGGFRSHMKWNFRFDRGPDTELLFTNNRIEQISGYDDIIVDFNFLVEFCKEVDIPDELILRSLDESFGFDGITLEKIAVWLTYFSKDISTEDLLMLKLEM